MDNENNEISQKINKEEEKDNNIKDLNELVYYIMEDDFNDKDKNSTKKKKNIQKKKKKMKKNVENNHFFISDKTQQDEEEERFIEEFKIKLENDSFNEKEVLIMYILEAQNKTSVFKEIPELYQFSFKLNLSRIYYLD